MRRMNVVNRKQALKVVKELDAFPKIPESYKETTASGGGISLVVFLFILVLVVSEFMYYTATDLKFDYEVDTGFEGKLKINVDLTIAMRCSLIGADVLDLTGQSAETFGSLEEEAVHFNLSPNQQQYMNMVQHVNTYIREEYHALHKFMWKSGYSGMTSNMPKREDNPSEPPDGCRLHGQLTVNKVAGNFHVTAGKHFPGFGRKHLHIGANVRSSGMNLLGDFFGAHAHFDDIIDEAEYNFSHRVDHFSFGEPTAGIVNPLDGELKISSNNYHMFQYFIQVVPTMVNTRQNTVNTYQFAVTEQNRTINHNEGSHGVPGIFMKYDLSPLKISVKDEHRPYWQFLVRLCGIIGGVFATSGLLHSIVGFSVDCLCCRYKVGKYKPKDETGQQHIPVQSLNKGLVASNNVDIVPGVSLLAQSHDTSNHINQTQ